MAFCCERLVLRRWTRQMLTYLIFNIAYLLFASLCLQFVPTTLEYELNTSSGYCFSLNVFGVGACQKQ